MSDPTTPLYSPSSISVSLPLSQLWNLMASSSHCSFVRLSNKIKQTKFQQVKVKQDAERQNAWLNTNLHTPTYFLNVSKCMLTNFQMQLLFWAQLLPFQHNASSHPPLIHTCISYLMGSRRCSGVGYHYNDGQRRTGGDVTLQSGSCSFHWRLVLPWTYMTTVCSAHRAKQQDHTGWASHSPTPWPPNPPWSAPDELSLVYRTICSGLWSRQRWCVLL